MSPDVHSKELTPALALGDRVTWRRNVGVMDRISPEGIHYHVTFDQPLEPGIPQLIDNGMWFYRSELTRAES